MTPLEIQLLKCIREYRRLSNKTVNDISEADACHKQADALLALEPELDNPNEKWDAPFRVEHREFIDNIFRRR